jgi:pyruvate kinase
MGARCIILLTTSGRAGRLVAKYRPSMPVFAVTNNQVVARQANASFGVIPLLLEEPITRVGAVVDKVVEFANKAGIIQVRVIA